MKEYSVTKNVGNAMDFVVGRVLRTINMTVSVNKTETYESVLFTETVI